MLFAGQQRGLIVVLKLQHHMAAHERCLQNGACTRVGFHFDRDAEDLVFLRRQAQFMQQADEAQPSIVNGAVDGLSCFQIAASR